MATPNVRMDNGTILLTREDGTEIVVSRAELAAMAQYATSTLVRDMVADHISRHAALSVEQAVQRRLNGV